ncbi:MAG: transposase [Desulfobacterales bacterium]|nr:transposase [Desulfobacterales bacterium]
MRRNRFSETKIISILKEGEAGISVSRLCRNYGIGTTTYYRWKGQYGGMDVSSLRRLKELEIENRQLKQMYANASIELIALKDVVVKKL